MSEIVKNLKTASTIQNVFIAFKECSEELQEHACAMFEIIADDIVPEDEKALAYETLIDILFPRPHNSIVVRQLPIDN